MRRPRSPASATPLDDVRRAARLLATPRGVRSSGREQAAEVAQPGGARAARRRRRGARRRRPSGRAAAARRRSRRRRAPAARPARTDGCRAPKPTRVAGPRRRIGRGPLEVGGQRHLEVLGVAGEAWTGMVQASSSAASSVNSRTVRREALERLPEQPEPGALGRLRGGQPWRSTVAATRPPATRLSVSATGTTGIAAPCVGGRLATRRDELARTQRPRPVVDEDTTRSSGPARAPRARERRPRPTPAVAAPPATTAATDCRQPGGVAAAPRRDPAVPRRRSASTTARRGEPRPASSAGAAGRRSAPRACRAAHRGSTHPAATTIASATRLARPSPDAVSRGAAGRRSSARRRSGGRASPRRRRRVSMNREPPSTTIIVPSSRKPTPWPGSLPSWMTRTRSSSPGRTAGFTAFARELMFRTRTPWSSATRFRLKSLVRTARLRAWRARRACASTSGDLGDVVLDDLDRRAASPSASGRGSPGPGGRGCGGACRSCRRCAAARRARSAGTTSVP